MTYRLRYIPKFPANISGANGLTVVREGVDLVVQPDYGDLVQVPSVLDPDASFFALWSRDEDSYLRMSFNDVFDAVSGLGFMQTSVYDPGNRATDAFNRANHFGTNTPSDGTVTTAKIADSNVTTAKIADSNVTTAKIANDGVTNAKLANMVQATVKGRASGAGTGDPTDLAASDLFTILNGVFPARPITSAGAGQFVLIDVSIAGNGYSLPSGGTWAYFAFRVSSSTGTVPGSNTFAGVAAGGAAVVSGSSGFFLYGFAWRVA